MDVVFEFVKEKIKIIPARFVQKFVIFFQSLCLTRLMAPKCKKFVFGDLGVCEPGEPVAGRGRGRPGQLQQLQAGAGPGQGEGRLLPHG